MAYVFAISLPVITIVFFVWFFMRMRRPRKAKVNKDDHNTRLERAVWAWATILSSSQEPVNTYHMARVGLQLEVHMPGTPAYQVSTTWLVEQESLPAVEQGKEISLKVDPLDPKYVYPSGGWAKFVE
jgi:heme/copper-type cytochrome/quinol oxidase subunit 2